MEQGGAETSITNPKRKRTFHELNLLRTLWALLKILLKKDGMEQALKVITIQGNPIVNSSAVPKVVEKKKSNKDSK
jgi:hypothetical protein